MSTSILQVRNDALTGFVYYAYTPSLAAAVVFVVLFACSTILHIFQMIRSKTWFMIPFCIGGAFEALGYVGRILSANEAPNYTRGPYIMQVLLLLIAPAFFAASIYMMLARVVLLVEGEHLLFIRRTWLTKIFVAGDVQSFLLQGAGGGLLAGNTPSLVDTGRAIVLAGLVVQVVCFGLFVIAGAIFHIRLRKNPTRKSKTEPWSKHMLSLYLVSIFIFIRSIVRVIEYAQGYTGYIMSHEAFLYVFDSTLMFLVVAIMNIVHPGEISRALKRPEQTQNHDFQMLPQKPGSPC